MLVTFFSFGIICSGMEVYEPNDGDILYRGGEGFLIEWNPAGGGSHVLIKLLQDGKGKGKIVNSTENDGKYLWPVDKLAGGAPVPMGKNFKIRITSTSTTASTLSKGVFSINFSLKILQVKTFKTGTAVAAPKPDLQVTNIKIIPSGPSADFHRQKARFLITVYNNGGANARACKMDLWLFCHKPGDIVFKPSIHKDQPTEHWRNIDVPAVLSKQSKTFEPNYGKYTASPQAIPGYSINFFGRWWSIIVLVDARGTVNESNEKNNLKDDIFWVPE